MFPPNLLKALPFALSQRNKESILLPVLRDMTAMHKAACPAYKRMVDVAFSEHKGAVGLAQVPFIPVSFFKQRSLKSAIDRDVVVNVRSSGTTGERKSRVDLDRATASLSARTLAHTLRAVVGEQRRPMLILDAPSAIRGPDGMSARAAAILGLMPLGREHVFALRENGTINETDVLAFIKKHAKNAPLLFGFTFLVWEAFLPFCQRHAPDLSEALLLHTGGWKKRAGIAVDRGAFAKALTETTGLKRIVNFYGMAEMPGAIMMENRNGLFYPPSFVDVIIRDPVTLRPLPHKHEGLVQILSLVPQSFAGHSLLTEDIGIIEATDNGDDGWKGHGFRIIGRLPKAAMRGCSQALADSFWTEDRARTSLTRAAASATSSSG